MVVFLFDHFVVWINYHHPRTGKQKCQSNTNELLWLGSLGTETKMFFKWNKFQLCDRERREDGSHKNRYVKVVMTPKQRNVKLTKNWIIRRARVDGDWQKNLNKMAGTSDDVLREPFLHKMTANHYTCVLIFRHLFSHPLLKVWSGDPTKIISSEFHCQKNETFQLKKVVALKHYLQIHSIHLVSHSIACYRHTRQTTIVQVSCIACVSMICS